MTKTQEKAVIKISALLTKWVNRLQENEVKVFEINTNENGNIVMYAVIGYKDEEENGTEFLRDYIRVFIGRHGGITYPVEKNGKYYVKKFNSIRETIGNQLDMFSNKRIESLEKLDQRR